MVRARALDAEAAELGLSIGDETLRGQVVQIGAFQGIDGNFDREAYRFALQQTGMTEAAFEETLREEAARTMLQGAIVSGVQMPQAYAATLVDYVTATRDFTWARLTDADLIDPLPVPDTGTLRTFYDADPDRFTLPASKRITYVLLTPDALLATVEVPEAPSCAPNTKPVRRPTTSPKDGWSNGWCFPTPMPPNAPPPHLRSRAPPSTRWSRNAA